jgi:hypothetical protein
MVGGKKIAFHSTRNPQDIADPVKKWAMNGTKPTDLDVSGKHVFMQAGRTVTPERRGRHAGSHHHV